MTTIVQVNRIQSNIAGVRRRACLVRNLLIGVLLCACTDARLSTAQDGRLPEGRTVETEKAAVLARGTLSLVIANRNGFVVASDSRMSASTGYVDTSQKVFRVNNKAALAIAGFASYQALLPPVDVQISAVLRHELNASVRHIKTLDEVGPLLNVIVGHALQVVASVAGWTPTPDRKDFIALVAGRENSGFVRILRLEFVPHYETYGAFDIPFPQYDMKSESREVTGFTWETAGVDQLAKNILDGGFSTEDPRVLKYYEVRKKHKEDKLPITDLRDLAQAILDLTKGSNRFVGGPTQFAVFPRHGKPSWNVPQFDLSQQDLPRVALFVGPVYSGSGYTIAKGKKFGGSIFEQFATSPEVPYASLFIGARFDRVPISLDGNVFVRSYFRDVHFIYQGGPFSILNSVLEGGCAVIVTPGVSAPPALGACRTITATKVNLDSVVGRPMKPVERPCTAAENKQVRGKLCKTRTIEFPLLTYKALAPDVSF